MSPPALLLRGGGLRGHGGAVVVEASTLGGAARDKQEMCDPEDDWRGAVVKDGDAGEQGERSFCMFSNAFIMDGIEDDMIGDRGLVYGGDAELEPERYDLHLGTPLHAKILAAPGGHSDNYRMPVLRGSGRVRHGVFTKPSPACSAAARSRAFRS